MARPTIAAWLSRLGSGEARRAAALLTQDQLLRCLMVTAVVGSKVCGVNTKGPRALQSYLIEAATQAKIRGFRMAGIAQQVWWPAGQDNDKAAFAP